MRVLLAGASGGVAMAIARELSVRGHSLWAISRSEPKYAVEAYLRADLTSPESVEQVSDWLTNIPQNEKIDCVINCVGLLHNSANMPEKSLKQISVDWLHQSLQVNLCSHIHLAQAVNPLVRRNSPIKWVSLSALVGSISQNELGGWYSYRMTKAALNMFIRNLDIEWRRKSPDSLIVALHPGTTKTPLSEPFQSNIAEGKLYETELTGRRLVEVIEKLGIEQSGKLLHWDGSLVTP